MIFFQVTENCCSDDGKKWKNQFKGVRPGFVCCNAPCNEMKSNQCPLPDHCKKIEGRSLGEQEQVSSQSVGINTKYLDHSYHTGQHYGNIYATPEQLKQQSFAVSIIVFFKTQNVHVLTKYFFFIFRNTKLLKSPLMTSLTCWSRLWATMEMWFERTRLYTHHRWANIKVTINLTEIIMWIPICLSSTLWILSEVKFQKFLLLISYFYFPFLFRKIDPFLYFTKIIFVKIFCEIQE